MESHKIIQVDEKVPFNLLIPLSIQHMFAMFGASVLVPFLFGINPAIVLFMNGVGTLMFIFITKGKAPAYLGSSFAFLAPAGIVIAKFGYEYALGGFVAVGFVGCILAFIIYKIGYKWIDVVLPPAAMGPVVALIGLELSSSAASNAGLLDETIDPRNLIVFLVTLGFAVFGSVLFRGFLSVIPILIAVIAVWSSTPPTPTLWLRAQMHVPADPAAAVTATAMAAAAAIIAAASAVVTGMAAARAMAAAGAATAPMCLSAPTPRAMPRMLPLWHPSAPSVWMTSRI